MNIKKQDIIKRIINRTHLSSHLVQTVYEALGLELFEMLDMVDSKNNVKIELFEGLNITAEYVSSKMYNSNLKSIGTIKTKPKIKAKAKFSKSYCNKLSQKIVI